MRINHLETACAWVAFLLLGIGIAMAVSAHFHKRSLPQGLRSPVLAMELLHDRSDVSKILGTSKGRDDDKYQMVVQMYLDFAFIPTYTTLFLLVGAVLYYHGDRRLAIIIGVLVISAAVFDLLENRAILRVIKDAASPGKGPRVWSLTKWALIFGVVALAARVYFVGQLPAFRRLLGFVAGGFGLVAAVLGLSGVVFGADRLIEVGSWFMALNLLGGLVFFVTHSCALRSPAR